MAKGRLIDTVHDRASGIRVEIRLDKATEHFTAEVEGERLTSPSLPDLRQQIAGAFARLSQFTWMPAIRVWLEDTDSLGRHHYSTRQAVLFVAFERMWIAQRPDGRLLAAPWEAVGEGEDGKDERRQRTRMLDRFELRPGQALQLPIDSGEYTRRMLLPYDEALYSRLCVLLSQMGMVQDYLHTLLRSTAGRAFMSDSGPFDMAWAEAAAKVFTLAQQAEAVESVEQTGG